MWATATPSSRLQGVNCLTATLAICLNSELSSAAVTPGAERHNTHSASGRRNNASLCLRAEHTASDYTYTFQPANAHQSTFLTVLVLRSIIYPT
jgi:hypothetical protein